MKALKQTNRKKEGKGKEKAFVRRMKKTKNQKIEDLQNQTIKFKKSKKPKQERNYCHKHHFHLVNGVHLYGCSSMIHS